MLKSPPGPSVQKLPIVKEIRERESPNWPDGLQRMTVLSACLDSPPSGRCRLGRRLTPLPCGTFAQVFGASSPWLFSCFGFDCPFAYVSYRRDTAAGRQPLLRSLERNPVTADLPAADVRGKVRPERNC